MSSMNDQQSFEYSDSLKALLYISTIIGLGNFFSIDNEILKMLIVPFLIPPFLQNMTRILLEGKNFKIVFKDSFSRQNKQKK